MILNPTKLLFDIASEHAKKLQKKQGREERGIVSTQVQGLIIALGDLLGKLAEIEEKKAQYRSEGAVEAYKMFLKAIKEGKRKLPGSNKYEIVVDARDIEEVLEKLAEKTNS